MCQRVAIKTTGARQYDPQDGLPLLRWEPILRDGHPRTTDNIAALSANELAASALVLARGHGHVGVKTLKTVDKALDKWFPLPANLTCWGTEDCDKKGVTESFGHAWGTFVNIEPYFRPTGAGLSVCASATDGGGSAPVSQFFFQELCAQAPRLRVPQPLRVGGLINWCNICIVHPVNTSAGNSFQAGFPFWEKAGWTEAYYLSRLKKEIGAINYARVYIADYLSDHGLNEMSLVSAHGRQRAQVLRDVMARKKFPYYLVDDLVEGFTGFLCKNVRDDVFSAVAPPSLTRWTTIFNAALRVDIADAVADWSTDILSHFNGIYTNQGSTWLWKERTGILILLLSACRLRSRSLVPCVVPSCRARACVSAMPGGTLFRVQFVGHQVQAARGGLLSRGPLSRS